MQTTPAVAAEVASFDWGSFWIGVGTGAIGIVLLGTCLVLAVVGAINKGTRS